MPLLQTLAPPIAMLHSVKDEADVLMANWCISRSVFTLLLDTLEEGGFATSHFAELKGDNPRSFAQKVILTFDDCAKHLLDFAVPELVRRNMKAVFYMPTAHIGGYNAWDVIKGAEKMELMNEADLRELVRLGMEVGSHSHHHIELGGLSDVATLTEEVSKSKQILEAITGQPVVSFAYPYGSVPAQYRAVLSAAGYDYAVGIYQPRETNLALRRFGVYEKDTTVSLRRKMSRRYRWMRSLYDAVKK